MGKGKPHNLKHVVCGALLLVILVATLTSSARADETDQFTLVAREQFADLGPYFTAVHYHVLKKVVDRANREIDKALKTSNKQARQKTLKRLHSSRYPADMVRQIFGAGFFEMRHVEGTVHSSRAKELYHDKIPAYCSPTWLYFYTHLPVDPRKLVLLFKGSTIKIYGAYLGTDKFGHFHDLGHIYFRSYLRRRNRGHSHEESMRRVVSLFSRGPISERAFIGLIGTGVFSNADLAVNLVGMKFYMNLTEPVRLEGKEQPPLLVRRGNHWRLNFHVRPESDFFEPFVSDHWNEALNPCIYEWGIRWTIARRLRKMADDIRAFYADENGQERPKEYFDQLAEELSTYYGEEYGHSGISDKMLLISEYCYPKEKNQETKPETPIPAPADDASEGPDS